ncbi:MAG: hypothetical protein RMI91_00685 [Gemmatales bacterium]|nr:hypothetical protein [Gemmatales bacterium]MDW7993148.1 hypothetical protein [Gemmatales bacterium]
MSELLEVLFDLITNFVRLLAVLATLALCYAWLLAWLAWWLWLVDWRRFWGALRQGAWLPLLMALAFVSYLAWSVGMPVPGERELGSLTPIALSLVLLGSVLLCGWLQTVFAWHPTEISLETEASMAQEHKHPGEEHGPHHMQASSPLP